MPKTSHCKAHTDWTQMKSNKQSIDWTVDSFKKCDFDWKYTRAHDTIMWYRSKNAPFWQLSINFDTADIHQILKGRNRLDRTVPSVDLILYEEPPSAVIFLSIIMESPYSAFLYASLLLLRSWTETCPELEWSAETTRG